MVANLDSIKEHIDIVEIIERYLPLKKAGVNYQACCPFHNEKSPSFIVSPAKQIFTCFGCGISGDAFSFIQKLNNVSFSEAVNVAADFYGLVVEYDKNAQEYKAKEQIQEKMQALQNRFLENLKKEPRILKYLQNRKITLDFISQFGLGVAATKDIKEILGESLGKELGLLNPKGFSFLENRISFAIHNYTHKIIGFAGRTHPYGNFKTAPKYINPKDSKIYKKSLNLYGLTFAKSHALKESAIFVLEGYLDVISAHILGLKNCVATCGTAFNLGHLNQILRIKKDIEIIFCFDNDEAGAQANLRAVKVCFDFGLYENVKVALLKSTHKDLNEVLISGESLKLEKFSALEFFIKKRLKLAKNQNEKDALVLELKSIIKQAQNFYAKEWLIENITQITKISKDYFLDKSQPKKSQNSDFLDNFLATLFSGDEAVVFIARENLIIQALPKEWQCEVKDFLESQKLNQKALSLNGSVLDSNAFYSELLDLHMRYFKSELESAKIQKDLKRIIAINQKLAELECEAKVQNVF